MVVWLFFLVRFLVINIKFIFGVVLICLMECFKFFVGFGLLGLRCMFVNCVKWKEFVICVCVVIGNRKNKMIMNIESFLFIDDDFICYNFIVYIILDFVGNFFIKRRLRIFCFSVWRKLVWFLLIVFFLWLYVLFWMGILVCRFYNFFYKLCWYLDCFLNIVV